MRGGVHGGVQASSELELGGDASNKVCVVEWSCVRDELFHVGLGLSLAVYGQGVAKFGHTISCYKYRCWHVFKYEGI